MCSRSRVSMNSSGTLQILMTSETRRYFRVMAPLLQAQVLAHVFAVSPVNFLENILGDFILRHPYHHLQIQVSRRFFPCAGTPLPLTRRRWPLCAPAGIFTFTTPTGVGTSMLAPRTASPTVMGSSMDKSLPDRVNMGCGRIRGTMYKSPAGSSSHPCLAFSAQTNSLSSLGAWRDIDPHRFRPQRIVRCPPHAVHGSPGRLPTSLTARTGNAELKRPLYYLFTAGCHRTRGM